MRLFTTVDPRDVRGLREQRIGLRLVPDLPVEATLFGTPSQTSGAPSLRRRGEIVIEGRMS